MASTMEKIKEKLHIGGHKEGEHKAQDPAHATPGYGAHNAGHATAGTPAAGYGAHDAGHAPNGTGYGAHDAGHAPGYGQHVNPAHDVGAGGYGQHMNPAGPAGYGQQVPPTHDVGYGGTAHNATGTAFPAAGYGQQHATPGTEPKKEGLMDKIKKKKHERKERKAGDGSSSSSSDSD